MKSVIFSCFLAFTLLCSCEKVVLSDSTTNTGTTDITPPTITTTDPASTATGVALNKTLTIGFSKKMNIATITSTSLYLKQGSTLVPGTVTYAGTTATFKPTSNLSANTVYTCILTTSITDVVGNALAGNYTWSFTTGNASDVIPPTISSVDPTTGATSVAISKSITANFNESIDPLTVTTTTFTLKQGSTTVAGVVTCSAQAAVFKPSSNLSTGTSYTATITTGVKDLAGNALASNYSWAFTTAAAPAVSFATDVMPIINTCNNCHTHGWTTSSSASTFYNNLVSRSYVVPSSYTSSKIYSKITGGHPGTGYLSTANQSKIVTWMQAGSLNN